MSRPIRMNARPAPREMNISDLFHSPRHRISEFAEMQLHLYRHDASLQDYFLPLHMETLTSAGPQPGERRAYDRLMTSAIRGADRISRFLQPQKLKADVLFCPVPYYGRKTENRFLMRTVLGLAQTGATVLCLLPAGAPFREELDAELDAAGRGGQVTFVDPLAPLNRMEAQLRPVLARLRGRRAFEETTSVLEPHGFRPGLEVAAGFEHTAAYVEAWERLAPRLEFDAAVVRCHWHDLCSPVCRTARARNKPVITFQQGVIGTTMDVPVTASRFVAFGRSSASLVAQLQHRFFAAAGMPEPALECVPAGSLYDNVTALSSQFDLQTVLMVDLPNAPGDFHGTESQCQALLQLGDRLLTAELPLRRLIIRPHPFWNNLELEECQSLVRNHGGRCELSHPAWSLDDDLRRSSVAAGVWSGVLTVASACGLPTVFIQTENCFATQDLACFSPGQTLMPDAAFSKIASLLKSRPAYDEARQEATRNAREYYAGGRNAEINGAFFARLLRQDPLSNSPCEVLH